MKCILVVGIEIHTLDDVCAWSALRYWPATSILTNLAILRPRSGAQRPECRPDTARVTWHMCNICNEKPIREALVALNSNTGSAHSIFRVYVYGINTELRGCCRGGDETHCRGISLGLVSKEVSVRLMLPLKANVRNETAVWIGIVEEIEVVEERLALPKICLDVCLCIGGRKQGSKSKEKS